MNVLKKVLASILAVIVLVLAAGGIYFSSYYRAVDIDEYMTSNDDVVVQEIKEGYFFDGQSGEEKDKAIIFYPGAKVEAKAYAPLCYELAREGIDCFIVKMPCNFAFFGINRADSIITSYSYDNWYMAGHSLGGVAASSYASKNEDEIKGLFLLASYSTEDFSNSDMPITAIYGSEDKVLNLDALNDSKTKMPSTFSVEEIEGGNHAQFGSYGEQKGDGTSTITQQQQIDYTVEIINATIN